MDVRIMLKAVNVMKEELDEYVKTKKELWGCRLYIKDENALKTCRAPQKGILEKDPKEWNTYIFYPLNKSGKQLKSKKVVIRYDTFGIGLYRTQKECEEDWKALKEEYKLYWTKKIADIENNLKEIDKM